MISPVIAGYLFEWQIPLPAVALIMACGSLIAGIALCFVRLKPQTVTPPPA